MPRYHSVLLPLFNVVGPSVTLIKKSNSDSIYLDRERYHETCLNKMRTSERICKCQIVPNRESDRDDLVRSRLHRRFGLDNPV